jgi:predicted deacetylase
MHRLNLSIDDVSPHELSSIRVIDKCLQIITEFSDAKFTLFVPTAYWRTLGDTATKTALSISQYPEFCAALGALPSKNFEICYHGHYHGIPHVSNNDELQHLSYSDALSVIDAMFNEVNHSGLFNVFKPILRPPAWRMSPETFDACADAGIEILALSADDYANKTYKGRDKSAKWINNIVYQTCNPPMRNLKLEEKTEVVYHACEWDKNYFSDDRVNELLKFLRENKGKFQFAFMKEML